jgi:hypothetical protein
MCLPIDVQVCEKGGLVLSKSKTDGFTEKVFVKGWAAPAVKKYLQNAVNLGRSTGRVGRYTVRIGNKFVSIKDTKESKTLFVEYASLGALLGKI